MSSVVWISCVLVVIVIAICSATTVATSESTSAGVDLTTLHSPHALAAIKRRLKRMEATETPTERAPPIPIPEITSSIKSIFETIPQKLQEWMWSTPADKMFKHQKLNEVDSTTQIELFKDPRFMEWATIVKKKYPNPTKAANEMLKTLVKHFKGDVALSKLLVAETMADSKQSWAVIAADLQKAQLNKWEKDDKTVEDVLQILELNPTEDNLLQDPLLLQLFAFAQLKHTDPLKAAEAMLTAFRKFYEDDAAWGNFLFAEMEGNSEQPFADIAANLQMAQLEKWIEDGREQDELFTLLHFKDMRDKLFQSSLFEKWTEYVFQKHPEDQDAAVDAILSTLRKYFGEEAELEDVLRAGSEVPSMKTLAFYLDSELLKIWLAGNKSVDDVLRLLKVETSDENLFKQPQFIRWLYFVKSHANVEFDRYIASDENARKEYGTELKAEVAMKDADKTLHTKDVQDKIRKRKHDWVTKDVNEVVISTLRTHYNNDDEVKEVLSTGLTSRFTHVRNISNEALKTLNFLTGKRLKRTELPHEGYR